MTVARVVIPGREVTIQEEARKLGRCSNCEFLCVNGNCSKAEKHFSIIDDENCPKIAKEK